MSSSCNRAGATNDDPTSALVPQTGHAGGPVGDRGQRVLATSFYEAHLGRLQANAEVWPCIQIFQSNRDGFELIVHNSGIGPALIRDYRIRNRGLLLLCV